MGAPYNPGGEYHMVYFAPDQNGEWISLNIVPGPYVTESIVEVYGPQGVPHRMMPDDQPFETYLGHMYEYSPSFAAIMALREEAEAWESGCIGDIDYSVTDAKDHADSLRRIADELAKC